MSTVSTITVLSNNIKSSNGWFYQYRYGIIIVLSPHHFSFQKVRTTKSPGDQSLSHVDNKTNGVESIVILHNWNARKKVESISS